MARKPDVFLALTCRQMMTCSNMLIPGGRAGTNFLIRSNAFEECGWSPEYTLTEDYALGMELTKRRWRCRYVEEYLAIGEAPEEVRNCFQQRSRWAKVRCTALFSCATCWLTGRVMSCLLCGRNGFFPSRPPCGAAACAHAQTWLHVQPPAMYRAGHTCKAASAQVTTAAFANVQTWLHVQPPAMYRAGHTCKAASAQVTTAAFANVQPSVLC